MPDSRFFLLKMEGASESTWIGGLPSMTMHLEGLLNTETIW